MAVVLTWFSVACFDVRVSVMFLYLLIIRLFRFWLLGGYLLGNSSALGWPFVLIVFCVFAF